MSANNLLMQFQADALGLPVVRPRVIETTALGAAFAAGLAAGFWPDEAGAARALGRRASREPRMDQTCREHELGQWRKAVARSLNWIDQPGEAKI